MKRTAALILVGLGLIACGSEQGSTASASAEATAKSSGSSKAKASGSGSAGATPSATVAAKQSAAPSAVASAGASASAAVDPDACPAGNKPPAFEYVDVKFTWSQTPKIEDAPKDKSVANVGDKTFVLPKVEVWVSEKEGTVSLRTNDGVLLGPSISFKGEPKAPNTYEDKWGSNSGYFQMPKKGFVAECHSQTTSYNGSNARILKLTKYDGKTADGSFVTTWEEGFGEKRKMWAAGTFKDAKVVVFKK